MYIYIYICKERYYITRRPRGKGVRTQALHTSAWFTSGQIAGHKRYKLQPKRKRSRESKSRSKPKQVLRGTRSKSGVWREPTVAPPARPITEQATQHNTTTRRRAAQLSSVPSTGFFFEFEKLAAPPSLPRSLLQPRGRRHRSRRPIPCRACWSGPAPGLVVERTRTLLTRFSQVAAADTRRTPPSHPPGPFSVAASPRARRPRTLVK